MSLKTELHALRVAAGSSRDRLRAARERLTLASEYGRIATWEWNMRSGVLTWNGCVEDLFGRPAGELTSFPAVAASFHEDDRAKLIQDLHWKVRQAGDLSQEFRVVWPDGSIHWLLAHGRRVTSSVGRPSRLIGIVLNVTERRLAEEALIQAEKLAAVGRLASSIAHEINNPLAAVTNYLYLARASEDLDEVRQYLGIIESEVRRVSAISSQTLLSQKRSTALSTISCTSLIESVLSLYRVRLRHMDIGIEIRDQTIDPLVSLEGEIRQVLGNLIGNAIDAMQASGGRLLIRARQSSAGKNGRRTHSLTVADTGAGIAAGVRSHIFQPFFTTRGFAGNGLGLWISHELVTRLDGTLRLRTSTREGKHGTVFVLTLPSVQKNHTWDHNLPAQKP